MKFRDLAWGAFLYANQNRGTQGQTRYDSLVRDRAFLQRLQDNPALDDFERLRDFLVHFGVRHAPKRLAQEQLNAWHQLKPHVERLSNERLETSNLFDAGVVNAIKGAFGCLQWPTVWGGDTVASKVLHFFNVHLFMMWDGDIQSAYGVSSGPVGYLEFLRGMSAQAKEALQDFGHLAVPGSPEVHL
ncbi:MAG: hypothetical protein ACOC6F_03145, partial [bacterium]